MPGGSIPNRMPRVSPSTGSAFAARSRRQLRPNRCKGGCAPASPRPRWRRRASAPASPATCAPPANGPPGSWPATVAAAEVRDRSGTQPRCGPRHLPPAVQPGRTRARPDRRRHRRPALHGRDAPRARSAPVEPRRGRGRRRRHPRARRRWPGSPEHCRLSRGRTTKSHSGSSTGPPREGVVNRCGLPERLGFRRSPQPSPSSPGRTADRDPGWVPSRGGPRHQDSTIAAVLTTCHRPTAASATAWSPTKPPIRAVRPQRLRPQQRLADETAAVFRATIALKAFKPKGGIILVGAIQVTLGRRA